METTQQQQSESLPSTDEPDTEHYHSLDLETPTARKNKCFPKLRDWYDHQQSLEEIDRHIIVLLIDYNRQRSWKKKALTVIVVCVSIYVIVDMCFLGYIIPNMVEFFEWASQNSGAALFAFVGVFAVATFAFIPPFFLTFASGFMYEKVYGPGLGIAVATGACFLGSFIGAIMSFVRSRYMMRDLVKLFSRKYPLVRAADMALRTKGFRVMLLLRLCPIIPFTAVNYIGGVTGMKWEVFSVALIGVLPMQMLTIAMGASAGSFTDTENAGNEEQRELKELLTLVGLLFGLIALLLTWNYAKDELRKEIKKAREDDALLAKSAQYQAYQEHLAAWKMAPDNNISGFPDSASTVKSKKKYIGKLHALTKQEMKKTDIESTDDEAQLVQSMPPVNNCPKLQSGGAQSEPIFRTISGISTVAGIFPADSESETEKSQTTQSNNSRKNDSSFDLNQLERYTPEGKQQGDEDEEWFWFWV